MTETKCLHCGHAWPDSSMRGQWPCITCHSNPLWGEVCERDHYRPGIILKKGDNKDATHLYNR